MKYAKVDQCDITLDDEKHTYDVLTIDDPCCDKNKIPQEVSSFRCENLKTQNGIRSRNGRLIFALFYTDNNALFALIAIWYSHPALLLGSAPSHHLPQHHPLPHGSPHQ